MVALRPASAPAPQRTAHRHTCPHSSAEAAALVVEWAHEALVVEWARLNWLSGPNWLNCSAHEALVVEWAHEALVVEGPA